MARKFGTPKLGVYLAGSDERLDVQTTHVDSVRFELARARLKWPAPSEAPLLWTTYLAWHALRREAKAGVRPAVPELSDKVEDSLDVFDAVVFLDDAGREVDADEVDEDTVGVDPTAETP